MAQTVKHLSTMRETWVQALGWEDPLEKEMAFHSSTLTWRIPWTQEPGSYSLWGHKESDTTERLHFHFLLGPYHFCSLLSPSLHEMFPLSNFLEEISSLSQSVVFLYFFALIAEEGFLISPCYSLELCIQMLISFLFSLLFASLLFTAICKASSDSHFAFFHFFFLGMVLIPVSCTMSWTSVHSSSGTLSIISNPLNLFLISTV